MKTQEVYFAGRWPKNEEKRRLEKLRTLLYFLSGANLVQDHACATVTDAKTKEHFAYKTFKKILNELVKRGFKSEGEKKSYVEYIGHVTINPLYQEKIVNDAGNIVNNQITEISLEARLSLVEGAIRGFCYDYAGLQIYRNKRS